jgi:hypothetical protein
MIIVKIFENVSTSAGLQRREAEGANKKSKGKKNEKKNLAATTQYSPTLFAFI